MKSYIVKENHIGSAVSEILQYKETGHHFTFMDFQASVCMVQDCFMASLKNYVTQN